MDKRSHGEMGEGEKEGEGVKEVCKNCLCYNDGWCEAFVVQKLPGTKGCFGFIPNKQKE